MNEQEEFEYFLQSLEQLLRSVLWEVLNEFSEAAAAEGQQDRGLLDSADVKQILQISDSTLKRNRKNRLIPYTKIGKKYYYPRAFILRIIKDKDDDNR